MPGKKKRSKPPELKTVDNNCDQGNGSRNMWTLLLLSFGAIIVAALTSRYGTELVSYKPNRRICSILGLFQENVSPLSLEQQQQNYIDRRRSIDSGAYLSLDDSSQFKVFTNTPCPTNDLLQQLKKIKIFCPHADMLVQENAGWKKHITQQIDIIRQALPYALNRNRLWHLAQTDKLEIHLVSSNHPLLKGLQEKNPTARFIPSDNPGSEPSTVLIEIDSTASFGRSRETLANELHHASTLTVNREKFNDRALRILSEPKFSAHQLKPFLDTDGKTSEPLYARHEHVLQAGFQRIRDFESLYIQAQQQKKRHEKRFYKPDPKLKTFYATIERYQPKTYYEELPRSYLEAYLPACKVLRNGKYTMPQKDNKRFYVHAIHHFPGSPATSQIDYSYAKTDSIHSRATAFFNDFSDIEKVMQGAGYRSYQGQTESQLGMRSAIEQGGMEWSSFIEELPPPVKKLFFPEWCKYFEEYTQTPNYCSLG